MNNILVALALICPSWRLQAQNHFINKKSVGVVVYKAEPDQKVIIYKQTGAPLGHLLMNDFVEKNNIIDPFDVFGESNALLFDCIGVTPKEYIIIANDKTGQVGYLRKSDAQFKFKTWPQYALGLEVVDFDGETNPLHQLPDSKSPIVKSNLAYDERFSPKAINGNWLKVTWGNSKRKSGWIRWKDDRDKFLVCCFYKD